MYCTVIYMFSCSARYGPSRGNYGGLPQTWSNSNISDAVTGSPGDNDPLDVLDISSIHAPIGGVYKVKVRLAAILYLKTAAAVRLVLAFLLYR
jgi:hypothetical protein